MLLLAFNCAAQIDISKETHAKSVEKLNLNSDKNPAPEQNGIPVYNPDEIIYDSRAYPEGIKNSKRVEENDWHLSDEEEGLTYQTPNFYDRDVPFEFDLNSFTLDTADTVIMLDTLNLIEEPEEKTLDYQGASRQIDVHAEIRDEPFENTEDKPSKSSNFDWDFSPFKSFIYGVLIILGIILVYIIVKLIIQQPLKNRVKTINAIDISTISEEELNPKTIEKSELELLLDEALNNKEFKVAVRVWYLQMLKVLISNNKIVWKKEKTNYDYQLELIVESYHDAFKTFSLFYDEVWYGDLKISEELYTKVEPELKQLYKKINE